MQDIPHAEAVQLLATPRICEEAGAWLPQKEQPGLTVLEHGLISEGGVGSGQYVQLQFRRSQKTGMCCYKFTVFQLNAGGPLRVYQLDVRQHTRMPRNAHSLSHEHLGDKRTPLSPDANHWTYSDVLTTFCGRTNITFDPQIPGPEDFALT